MINSTINKGNTMWNLFKKWFNKDINNSPINILKQPEQHNTQFSEKEQELEDRRKAALRLKDEIQVTSLDWFQVKPVSQKPKKPIVLFSGYAFKDIVSLKSLYKQRQQKKLERIQLLKEVESSVISSFEKIKRNVVEENLYNANILLSSAQKQVQVIGSASLIQQYRTISNLVFELKEKLEERENNRKVEEARKQEEEASYQKELLEQQQKIAIAKSKQAEIERQAKAEEYHQEVLQKEKSEQEELKSLMALSSVYKDNYYDFQDVLNDNNINYLYHFTDRTNLISIKRRNGLLSWDYCNKHHITIPCQGGDVDSQNLDKKYGLEDYVRLSFCKDHPMAYRLKQSGSDIVVLKISRDVALINNTLYSNMNATDNLHSHGGSIEDLKAVNFEATKMEYVSRDNANFKPHQAEVMVKTFIPKKFILNLDTV